MASVGRRQRSPNGTPVGQVPLPSASKPSSFEAQLQPAALLQFSNVAVLGVAPDGTIGSWNRGCELIFGYRREEVLGKDVSLLAAGRRQDEQRELRARAMSGEFTEPLETVRLTKDGREVRILIEVSPVQDQRGTIVGTAAVIRDITKQREAEEKLRESEERYRSVVEALHDGVLIVGKDGGIIAFNQSAVRILGDSQGLREADANNPRSTIIAEDGRPIAARDLPHRLAMEQGRAINGVVMGVVTRLGGVRWLEVNSAPLYRPGEAAPYAAVASFKDSTGHKEALDALNAARLEDLQRLALLSEFRDDETKRHTERVARCAQLIAVELGLDEEYVWMIARAAPLHDVGKVGIPDAILLKAGPLSDEEFQIMKRHTSIGGEILADSDFNVLQMGMEIALSHHERYDGGGYPRGLKGEEIPLCGRIVAVADAFDAMTHDRPYRKALPAEEAAAEIKRCAGTQFDPRVVQAFLRLDPRRLADH